jgi:hypothetical protein
LSLVSPCLDGAARLHRAGEVQGPINLPINPVDQLWF